MPTLFMSLYLQYGITVKTCYRLIPWVTEPGVVFILREKCKLCIISYKHGFFPPAPDMCNKEYYYLFALQ